MQELLTDAQWHMATLTTLPNGTRGFQMYLDGQLAAEMVGSHNYFRASTLQHMPTTFFLAVERIQSGRMCKAHKHIIISNRSMDCLPEVSSFNQDSQLQ